MTSDNKSVLAFNLSYMFHEKELLASSIREMLTWLSQGRIVPPKVTLFPLADVASAHRAIESGLTTGKLILTVDRDGARRGEQRATERARKEKSEKKNE
jgi:NADPH:quinone reductase-like Zn-dependent oxidoreductase